MKRKMKQNNTGEQVEEIKNPWLPSIVDLR